MMKNFLFLLLLISGLATVAQSPQVPDSLYKPDPHYLEDQIYFGISYIVLKNLPLDMAQNGFSNTVKLGFIRDIPLNERRNFGIGLGAGLSWDNFYQNLRITVDEQTGEVQYHLLPDGSYRSNSFSFNKIDFPFEIRWRGSTAKKYKFWRLYAGITGSYVYRTASNFVADKVDLTYKHIKIIKNWQFGLNISAGYGTWNFNFYYGLNNILKDQVELNGEKVNLRTMKFGFVYYFL